jgi:hypothetical protein
MVRANVIVVAPNRASVLVGNTEVMPVPCPTSHFRQSGTNPVRSEPVSRVPAASVQIVKDYSEIVEGDVRELRATWSHGMDAEFLVAGEEPTTR